MAKPQHNGLHPKIRAAVAVEMSGATTCVLCGQVNCPKTKRPLLLAWDLAHDDERSTPTQPVWLGPAHPYCNRREWSRSWRSKRGRTNRMVRSSVVSHGRGRVRRVSQVVEIEEVDE